MGELMNPYEIVHSQLFNQIKEAFWEAPLDTFIASRIIWRGLNGKVVATNAVPFWNLVCRDAAYKKDKTWQRFRYWSEDLHKKAALSVVEQKVSSTAQIAEKLFGRVCEKNERGILVRLYSNGVFQKYGLTDVPFPAEVEERAYFIGPALVRYSLYIMGSAWAEDLLCPFAIVVFDHPIFQMEGSARMNDWLIIHHFSGQAERRAARVGAAAEYGKFLSEMFPMPRPYYPALAIMNEDFSPALLGGYITTLFGKYCLSSTNQSGYYKVVKELPSVRFIELVEPYKIIEVQDDEPIAPWLLEPGYTLARLTEQGLAGKEV
jgi:hypothetical protein